MKERMEEMRAFLEKKEKITRLDLLLSLLIALVAGVIIGFMTNPKRPRYIGCFNGNFNGTYGFGDDEEEQEDDEEEGEDSPCVTE